MPILRLSHLFRFLLATQRCIDSNSYFVGVGVAAYSRGQWCIFVNRTSERSTPVPDGSDVMTELKKCVEFCKKALA
jgi:hypothetical protein